jgi:hypothetical protein
MIGCLSASADSFDGNEKRPPMARQRRFEGLTTRRSDLPMAVTHPMYPSCSVTPDSLPARSNDG